ncbi:MAG: ParB/RepB/Spo0J family partition protein [Clostridiales bacterium]|nr:ParB/RepB/Spo0J family partition protein [Clostridiales bacterium]
MAGRKGGLGRGLESLFGEIEIKVPVTPAKPTTPTTTTTMPAASSPAVSAASSESVAKTGKKPRKSKGTARNAPTSAPEATPVPENAVLNISIDDIKPNSMQPRQDFDAEGIEELAASIEAQGLIQPVVLTKAKTGYELVTGERRWRAIRKLGLKTIPAIILAREVTSEEKALLAIIENVQRKDLKTLEEAKAYRKIIDKYGMTQEALARAVGKSRPHIANTLRMLALPPEILELLHLEKLTLGHANALGAVKDTDQQIGLARKIVSKSLSVREAERLAAAIATAAGRPAKKKRQHPKTNEIRIVEQELTSTTGIRTVITGDGEKGSVELKYFDRQGLEEIIDLLRTAGMHKR